MATRGYQQNLEVGKRAHCYYVDPAGVHTDKVITISKRTHRHLDSLLDECAVSLAKGSVRAIHSSGGTKLQHIDDISSEKKYVVIGPRSRFNKKLNYTQEPAPRKVGLTPRDYTAVKPVTHNPHYKVQSRVNQITNDVRTITVFLNGDRYHCGCKLAISTKTPIEECLQTISEKVKSKRYCNKLYHLPDQWEPGVKRSDVPCVHDTNELQHGARYIAVPCDKKLHRSIPYGSYTSNQISPRARNVLPPIRPGGSTKQSNATDTYTSVSNSTPTSVNSNKSDERKRIKTQKSKKKEDSVFHAKPIQHKRSGEKHRQADYDADEGGVFKSKKHHEETSGAKEVEETDDTKVDIPIDQVDAEEVEEIVPTNEEGDITVGSDKNLYKLPSSEGETSVKSAQAENSSPRQKADNISEMPQRENTMDHVEEETELKSHIDNGTRRSSVEFDSEFDPRKKASK